MATTRLAIACLEAPALLTEQQSVACGLDVRPVDGRRLDARGDDGGFIQQVRELCAARLRHQAREPRKVHVAGEQDLPVGRVQPQDCLALRSRGKAHGHRTVEAARAEERQVEVLGRLVAAITTTPSDGENPSISTSN